MCSAGHGGIGHTSDGVGSRQWDVSRKSPPRGLGRLQVELCAEPVQDPGEEGPGRGGVHDVGDIGVARADLSEPVDVRLHDRGGVGGDRGGE